MAVLFDQCSRSAVQSELVSVNMKELNCLTVFPVKRKEICDALKTPQKVLRRFVVIPEKIFRNGYHYRLYTYITKPLPFHKIILVACTENTWKNIGLARAVTVKRFPAMTFFRSDLADWDLPL